MKKTIVWILLLAASIGMMYFIARASGLPWQLTESLLLMIGVHELGHLGAAKYLGYRTAGFYFLPGLGGAALLKEMPKIRWHCFIIWYAGPLVGFAETLILAIVNVFWWQSPLVWQMVSLWSAINFINLLPILPLDGGMIFWSINSGCDESFLSSFAFYFDVIVSAVFLNVLAGPIFTLLILFFAFSARNELINLWKTEGDREPMTRKQLWSAFIRTGVLMVNLALLFVFSSLLKT